MSKYLKEAIEIVRRRDPLMENAIPQGSWRDEDAMNDLVVDSIQLSGDNYEETGEYDLPEGASLVALIVAPEGTYRPGAVEEEVYVLSDGRVAGREILSGDNDHILDVYNFKAHELSKYFVEGGHFDER